MTQKKRVHFMGIAGSGMAAAALIAQAQGFQVSGCDLEPESYYSKQLIKKKIKIASGHSPEHIRKVDILVVTPAVLDINPDHPEIVKAKEKILLMTWQEFMGKYLQKGKYVIAVAGTHGKGTTTTMAGLVLEKAGLEPTVEVGGLVHEWQANARIGKSRYFVCEADEFNNNFLHYSPAVVIINNIEMDHPEFFKDFKSFLGSFEKFIRQQVKPGILIVNLDDKGVRQLLKKDRHYLIKQRFQVIGYRLGAEFKFPLENEYQAVVKDLGERSSLFGVKMKSGVDQKAEIEELFRLKLPGLHNISNCLGVIALARCLNIDFKYARRVFETFEGLGRRLELLGQTRGVKVFDDYGYHPTAIAATIKAVRQKYSPSRVWAVFEPHQFSRVKLFQKSFSKALDTADRVIVTKIFPGREEPIKGISSKLLIKGIRPSKARYEKDFERVAQIIACEAKQGDAVLVFGAGKSYQLSQMILDELKVR
jgi:UDP-N-acetylmuramate--alanine ligase